MLLKIQMNFNNSNVWQTNPKQNLHFKNNIKSLPKFYAKKKKKSWENKFQFKSNNLKFRHTKIAEKNKKQILVSEILSWIFSLFFLYIKWGILKAIAYKNLFEKHFRLMENVK